MALLVAAACSAPATPVGGAASAAAEASASPAGGFACTADPMLHVYHPDRLRVLNPCVTVSGTVAAIRSEADGDYHVLIRLDPGQTCAGQNCLDTANVTDQHGDLVTEPVCMHEVTQADAISACAGYQDPVVIPALRAHTTVSGPWVLDLDHGWNEIHPVERYGG